MNNATKFGLLALLAALLLGGVLFFIPEQGIPPTVEQDTEEITVTLTIEEMEMSLSVQSGATALAVLYTVEERIPELDLQTEEYEGLGTLVKSMYGKENGTGDKYWQYEVNGIAPQVGAGSYVVNEGDAIHWLFKTSDF